MDDRIIDIGAFDARTCGGVSRRSMLRLATALPLGASLSGISGMGASALAAESAKRARAKSVIFVFLWGAPSHLDTCDPKPNAPAEFRGPFGVIPTRTPGVHFTELLPQMAKRSDRFTLVRSHATTAPGHPDAGTVALTGFEELPQPVQPNFGSIIAKHRGHDDVLPPFFSIASGVVMDGARRIEGFGGGTLGRAHDPFLIGCDQQGEINLPGLQWLDDINPARIVDRRQLSQRLDRVAAAHDLGGPWNRATSRAFDLLTNGPAKAAFDLTQESKKTRDRYGWTVFGQSALLARRLAEAGVPYIQLNYSRHVEAINPGFEFGWDTHIYNFELLQDWHCPILDRVYSTLLDDLYDRGLIDQTLVVCMGEFGRTPRISARAARDHWPPCYFSLWSGAGIEPGRVIGESDARGEYPKTEPYSPLQVGTTIAELAGVNSEARAEMRVLANGRVIPGLV